MQLGESWLQATPFLQGCVPFPWRSQGPLKPPLPQEPPEERQGVPTGASPAHAAAKSLC